MMAQLVPIIFINNNTNTHHLHELSPFSDAEGSAGVNLVVGSHAFERFTTQINLSEISSGGSS